MPITITEERGISGDALNAERRFFISGTPSLVDARAALVTWLTDNDGLTFASLPYKDAKLDEDVYGAWRARVVYSAPTSSGGGGGGGGFLDSVSFDTSGATRKVTRGLDERKSTGAPSVKNLIALGEDNKAVGVEAVARSFNFSCRKYLLPEQVTVAYIGALFIATGTINNAEWSGFRAGEVVYRGVRGSRSYAGPWEMEFFFTASPTPNMVAPGDTEPTLGLTVVEGKTGPIQLENCGGWDAIWTMMDYGVIDIGGGINVACPVPIHLYANKVYESSNFNLLNAI